MGETRILIVEDDRDIARLLSGLLRSHGYDSDRVFCGKDCYDALCNQKEHYALVLLDLMLPDMDGKQLLSQIRLGEGMPVIVLSAMDATETKVQLLKLGADDYVTKPFDIDELMARVESVLRRSQRKDPAIIEYLDIRLSQHDKTVHIHGTEVLLTAKELALLALLLTHPNKVFSKQNLYESIWNEDYIGDDRVIKAHISNLRSKLNAAHPGVQYIDTIWGIGYRIARLDVFLTLP